MGLYKRIFMEIIRRPFRAVTIAFMILVLSLASLVGVFLHDIVKTAYQEYIKIEGYSIAIENNNQESIPNEISDEILALDYIIGCNNNSNLYDYFRPVDFINIPYDGNDQEGNEEAVDVILYANINTSLYGSFRNNEMILIEGTYPDSKNKGVLIDEKLAKKNELSIGKSIKLYSKVYDKVVDFNIIGIYKTLEAPNSKVSNDFGTHYTVSANSYIFCDYDSYFKVSDRNSSITSLIFYVNEYDNILPTYKKIEEIVLPEGYGVINCLESTLSYYGKVILTLKNTTSSLLGFTYITSLFILFLMTLLWMRDHYYEAGIYIALGTEKYKIVLYFVLEILTIAVSSLIVSILIGRSVVYTYRNQLLNLALRFTNSKFLDNAMESKVLEHAFSVQSLLYASVIYLVVVLVATLLSSTIIANYNPRELFDKE